MAGPFGPQPGGEKKVTTGSTTTLAPRKKITPFVPSSGGASSAKKPLFVPKGGGGGGEKKPRSLLNQYTDMAKGLAPGLLGLAEMGVKSVYRPTVELVVQGKRPELDTSSVGSLLGSAAQHYSPLVSSLAVSMGDTGKNIGGTWGALAHGNPTESPYWKAQKEGRILDVLTQDLGNVAMLAGGVEGLAGKVGDVAGATEAASRLSAAQAAREAAVAAGDTVAEQAARQAAVEASGAAKALRPRGLAGTVGKVAPRAGAWIEAGGEAAGAVEKVANRAATPIPFPFAGPVAKKLGGGVFERFAGERPAAWGTRKLVERGVADKSQALWRRISPEGRQFAEVVAQTDDEVMAEAQRWADVGHIARQAGLSDVEMTTARLAADERLEPLRAAQKSMTDDQFDELVRKVWGERETPAGRVRPTTEDRLRPTPDEVRAALDYEPGRNAGLDKTIEALTARMTEDSASRGYAPGADTLVDGWEDTDAGRAFLERYDAKTEAIRQANPQSFDWQAREIARNNHTIDPFAEEPGFGLHAPALYRPRKRLEGLTEAARRQAARDTTEALKAQRIAKASQALRMEIPAPESPWQSFDRGTEVGRADAMVARRQAAMVATQARLARVLAEYEAATDAADVERLAKRLDRETARWFDDQAQLEYLQERHGLAKTFDTEGPIYERGTGKKVPPEEPAPGPDVTTPEPPPLVTGPHMTRRFEVRTEATAAPRATPTAKRVLVPRAPGVPEAPKVSTPQTEALRASIAAARKRMEAAREDAKAAPQAPLSEKQAAALRKRMDAAEVAVQIAKGPKQKRTAMRRLQAAKDAAEAPARRRAEAALKRYRAARAEVAAGEKALARLESPRSVTTEGRRTLIPKEAQPVTLPKHLPRTAGAVPRLSSKPITAAEWSPAKARHPDTALRAGDVSQEAHGVLGRVGTVLIPEKVPFGGDVAEYERKIGRKLHGHAGGEHDWITEGHVDPAEVERLTANGHIKSDWSKGGTGPDQIGAHMSGDISDTMGVDEAVARWLEVTRRADAASVLESGGRAAATLDQQFAAYGFGSAPAFTRWLNETFGTDVLDPRSELETAASAFAVVPREVARTIRDMPTWATDLLDAEARLDAARKEKGYSAEWGSEAAEAAQARTAELLPTAEARRLWDAGDTLGAHEAAVKWLEDQRVLERQTAGERGGRARLNRRLLGEMKEKATPKLLLTKAMRDEAVAARDFLSNEGLADMIGKTEEAGGLLGAATVAAKGADDLLSHGAAQAYEGGKALSDLADDLDKAIKAGDASTLRKLLPEARRMMDERKAATAVQAVQDVAQEARVVADDLNRIKSGALKGFDGELVLQKRHGRLVTPDGKTPKGMAEWKAALEARDTELSTAPKMPEPAPAARPETPRQRRARWKAAAKVEGGATRRTAVRFAAEGGEVPPPPGGTVPPVAGGALRPSPGGPAAGQAARQAALDVARQRGKVERQTQVVARLRKQLESAVDNNSAEVPRLARRLDAVQSELTRREAALADGERLAEAVRTHAQPTPAEEAIARSWGCSQEAKAPAGGYEAGSIGAEAHARGASDATIRRKVKPGGAQARIAEDARIQERHAAAVRKAKASNARVLRLERRWADYPAEVARSAQENLVDVSKRGTSRVVRTAYRTLGDYGLKRIGGYTEWKGIGGETQAAITGQLGRTLRQIGMTEAEHAEVMAAFRDVWDGRQAGDPGYSAEYLDVLHDTSVGRRLDADAWRDLERSSAIEDAVIDVNLIADDAMTYKRSGRYIENPRRARAIIDRLDFLPADRVNELDKIVEEWKRSRERTITDRGVSIEAIPRRYRPAAITARRALQAYMDTADELVAQGVDHNVIDDVLRLAADTPSNLEGLVGMGLDPTYFTGGTPVDRLPGRMRGITRKTERAAKKMQTGQAVKTLEDTIKLQAVEAIKQAHNRATDQIAVTFGRSVDDVIGDQLRDYRSTHGESMAPADVERAMKAAGWSRFTSAGGAQPVWIPEAVAKAASAQSMQAGWGWQKLARWNRAYKTMVLPFSARWYTGNIVGNAMMAWVGGGTSPLAMMRARKAMGWDDRGIIRTITRGSLPGKKGAAIREQLAMQIASGGYDSGGKRAGRLSSAGLLTNERLVLGLTDLGESQARTLPGRGIEKVASHGYAVNEFVDNFMRSMVWYDRLEAEVRKTVEATGRGVLTDAERAAAGEAAMTATLNAMGDFSKMTPTERLKVRQVIPFYAWMRHSTQFILRLPVEHPGRAVFLLRLNDLFSDPDMQGDMIDMIGGRLPMPGGGYLDLRFLSPFQDPTRVPLLPNEAAKSVSPFLKIGLAGLTGLDLNKMGQVTRPPNKIPRGPFGETLGRGLYARPSELVGYATSQIPLAARTRDVVLGPKVRYGSGAVVKSKGKPLTSNRSRIGQGLGILGVPYPEKVDAAGIAARKRKRTIKQSR